MITLLWAHAKLIIFFLNSMFSTANRVIKNTGFLYAKMGITMFISLYTTRLILNSLGASDFGIFNIVGGAIAMLGFLNAAMASATQRFMSYSEGEGNKEKQKSIFNVSFVLHLGISFVVGIALLIAGYFFFNGILNIPDDRIFAAKVVYGSLIVSTMFTVMTVPYDAAMNAHENMKYYAIIGIFESFLKLAVAFACVYTTFDKLIVYGSLMACIPLITLTIMRVYCHRHYEECVIAPRTYWNKGLMKEMTSFAGWNFFSSISGIVTQYGLGIVINHFFGVLLNAAQGIANQVSGVLMTFSQNALKALNPIIVKSEGANNHHRLIYTTLLGCRISFTIFGLFSFPILFYMPQILQLWLDEVPEWAVVFCRLQLIRILLEQLTLSLGSAISAHGVIRNHTLSRSILNICPLIILPVLFYYQFPPYWLYIVWISCWSVFGGIVNLYYSIKLIQLPLQTYVKDVFIPCIAISIILIFAWTGMIFIQQMLPIGDNYYITFTNILFIVLIYLYLAWRTILKPDEREITLSIIKSTFCRLFKK